MHFSLVLVDHPEYGLIKAFNDAILPIYFGLRRLGYEVEILRHQVRPGSRHIVFGSANDPALSGLDMPADSIMVNLEQLAAENSSWNRPAYLEHLKGFTVWDYSRRNIEYLAGQSIQAAQLTLGYVPEMTRLRADLPAGRDVLFYGLASPRRQAVLDELKASGVSVSQPPIGTFGRERDVAIADSRLYLNIHHYQPASLEVVRLGYLWANHKPVVSERRADTEIYPGLEDACLYCTYEELAEKTRGLLSDEPKLKVQGLAGFEAFSGLSMAKSLESLVGRRLAQGLGALVREARPKHLHVGSGRDFRNDALNIDISAHCSPDLVLDISRPFEAGARFQTDRFGEVELTPGSFELITAFDVLEHVADLPQTMLNFLDLLEDGGRLIAKTPYDLSRGAWQDPTHVRALNENSWLYYTDWAWYLGWGDFRFELEDLSFNLSNLGAKMVAKGADRNRLTEIARAIDSMTVVLRKRPTSEEEKLFQRQMFRNIYEGAQISWEAVHEDLKAFENERRAVFRTPGSLRKARLELLACTAVYYFYKILAAVGLYRDKKEIWKKKRKQKRCLIRV